MSLISKLNECIKSIDLEDINDKELENILVTCKGFLNRDIENKEKKIENALARVEGLNANDQIKIASKNDLLNLLAILLENAHKSGILSDDEIINKYQKYKDNKCVYYIDQKENNEIEKTENNLSETISKEIADISDCYHNIENVINGLNSKVNEIYEYLFDEAEENYSNNEELINEEKNDEIKKDKKQVIKPEPDKRKIKLTDEKLEKYFILFILIFSIFLIINFNKYPIIQIFIGLFIGVGAYILTTKNNG